MSFFLLIAVVGLFLAGSYKIKGILGGFSHKSDAGSFSQQGVTVDYKAQTITIKSNTYPLSAIRGVRTESGPQRTRSRAFIKVDDMNKPVHEIVFYGDRLAEQFLERLTIAIEKAGGPHLTPY